MKARFLFVAAMLAAGSITAGPEDKVRANYLITVADDFIVDIYHNGQLVPDAKRSLLVERFGATVERIDLPVRDGDWVVFNVVNNRMRWGGTYYFGVAGCYEKSRFGFVSELDDSRWSACDDPALATRYIQNRDFGTSRPVQKVSKPWSDGPGLMRKSAGDSWEGSPIWGESRNTWIKYVAGPEMRPRTGGSRLGKGLVFPDISPSLIE